MNHDFYIYVLFDAYAVPRYVGKGRGRRINNHEGRYDKSNPWKNLFISTTLLLLGNLPKIKLHEGLNEETAYEFETAFIRAIGRHPAGPLLNMNDGGAPGRLLSIEERKARAARSHSALTPEQRSARTRKGQATIGARRRREIAVSRMNNRTLEERVAWAALMREIRPPDVNSAEAKARFFGLPRTEQEKILDRLIVSQSKRSPEERSASAKRWQSQRSSEERSSSARLANQNRDKAAFSAAVNRAQARRSPEERSASIKLANARRTPEQKRAAHQKRLETIRKRRGIAA